jgi:hypothetical protein
MDRRTFTKSIAFSSCALMAGPQIGCVASQDATTDTKISPNDFKKVFWKKGACSTALFYILNREFSNLKPAEELAAVPLAGGIMGRGYQCGMLWGASLAVGADSFRRYKDHDQAIGTAIAATQSVYQSFTARTKCADCREITKCDWGNKISLAKHIFSGRVLDCFNLIEKWGPEAIQSARHGLSHGQVNGPHLSCASEVAKKMGASDEEAVMVAGFAGGIGLSGNACGALSAAIWMKTLAWCREHPGKTPPMFKVPGTDLIFKAFYDATGTEILCHKIAKRSFSTPADHTTYLQCNGCTKLINSIAQA